MAEQKDVEHDASWFKSRISRHVHAMLSLAWPAMLSRVGIILLGITDTVLVGHYSTHELAYLNLGSSTLILLVLVMTIGLFFGTLVHVAHAFGRKDFKECGQVWKRSLPFAAGVGLLVIVIFIPSEFILKVMGQTDELSREAGRIMFVLSFGIIGNLFYVNCVYFLEAVGRGQVAIYVMIFANIANVIMSYILIYGMWGFPEMGALGSATVTTILRLTMGIGLVSYLYYSPKFDIFGMKEPARSKWVDWKEQRHLGFAASLSLGAELAAFSTLTIFAGFLGTLELATFGVVLNIMSLPFMLATGMGVATSVRVAISKSRKDANDAATAGWTGLGLSAIMIGIGGLFLFFLPNEILSFYSEDPRLISGAVTSVVFAAFVLILDGGQAVLSSALRGLGETWGPMYIQAFSFIVVMIPLSYWLSITLGHGVLGLVESILYATLVSFLLLSYWFHKKVSQV
ncbi:MAG: MATE family efflux transporter [Sphingomonadales bacterium]